MDWRSFYAEAMWTNRFWAWGAAYTIVLNRHIGLDIGTGRRAVDVPALCGGRIVIVTKTQSMGWVVVVDTGLPGNRRYHAYCHLSADRLPRAGATVARNERIGRLAAGPKGVAYSSVEYPGTAWDGIHLHLVFSDVAHGSYTRNTGATFANPEDYIREALSGSPAGGGAQPFDPEEDELNERQAMMLEHIFATMTPGIEGVKFNGVGYNAIVDARDNAIAAKNAAVTASDSVTPGIPGVKFDGALYSLAKRQGGGGVSQEDSDAIKRIEAVVVGKIPRQGGAMGGTTDLKSVIAWFDQNIIGVTTAVLDTREALAEQLTEGLAKATGTDPGVIRAAVVEAIAGTALDPDVAAKRVADEIANRLQS